MSETTVYLGTVLHCVADPWSSHADTAVEWFDEGYLVVQDGRVLEVGDASHLDNKNHDAAVVDYRGNYIVPGFVDAHLHFPQTGIIASHGAELLEWLRKYTFPEEARFGDAAYAARTAKLFVDELLRNGTTSALAFSTIHEESVDALFNAASDANMRFATGKVMMDRNCPENLRDTPETGYESSLSLIEKWHGKDRLTYAVTPRFAPTSSDEQLKVAARLFAEHDGVYLQSHVAENKAEVEWVAELFPWSRSYLDVYDHFGLLGERAVYAHCIYLDDTDISRLAASGSTAAFCPTSNLFLGSGLFDLARAKESDLQTALATDVGGGTSFSMLRTADEAYKVSRLAGSSITPQQLFYEMTMGGAKALHIDSHVGNFSVGKEADFVVLDPNATTLLAHRVERAECIEEVLFALIVLGDDRCTRATHTMGKRVYARQAVPA